VLTPLREPGEQPFQAPGLPQIRRQHGRGERLPLVGGPAVTDPWLLNPDGPDTGLGDPLGQVAVADDLAVSLVVHEVGMLVNPGGDLGPDGLGQEASGPVLEEVGEHVRAGCQGHDSDLVCRLTHDGGTPRSGGLYGVLVTVASPRIPHRPSPPRTRLSVIPPTVPADALALLASERLLVPVASSRSHSRRGPSTGP
jgi:hypothetical protein